MDTVDILVAGSVALDLNCDLDGSSSRSKQGSPQLHTSNPASIRNSIGGVGYNVARAAHLAGGQLKVKLCSLVGNDIAGTNALEALRRSGLDAGCVRIVKGSRTAQYVAINGPSKDLVMAASDMGIFTDHAFSSDWKSVLAAARAKWVVVDANWSESGVCAWARTAKGNGCQVAYEPVSVAKSCRLFAKGSDLGVFPRAHIDMATPNSLELAAMYQAAYDNEFFNNASWFDVIDSLGMRGARDRFVRLASAELTDHGVPVQSVQLLPYIPTIITKLGARGVLLTSLLSPHDPRLRDSESAPYILARSRGAGTGGIYMRLFPAAEVVPDAGIASVNGVGDTLLGVLLAALVRRGEGAVVDEQLVLLAQRAAVMTLKSGESVSPEVQTLGRELGRIWSA